MSPGACRCAETSGHRCTFWCRSYKGSHLALMVEISGGGPGGGRSPRQGARSANWGNLIVAIDPGKLGGSTQDFSAKVTALLQRVKGARKAPGVEEVVLPGERGYRFAGDAADHSGSGQCR